MEFLLSLVNSFPILTINHKNEALRARIIMAPEGSDFVLSSNVPDIEFHIFVCYRLHIESDCDESLEKLKDS